MQSNLDILDVIKNLQTVSENNNMFTVLKDFERVLDELDIYVYKNWEDGELILGPKVSRYTVSCSFMWDLHSAPDPAAAKILVDYGCEVVYEKKTLLVPRKIKEPSDYRPGTKKGKIDEHPIWIVTIDMPKKLMQDVDIGKKNREHNQMAELMKYDHSMATNANDVAQEEPNAEDQAPEA